MCLHFRLLNQGWEGLRRDVDNGAFQRAAGGGGEEAGVELNSTALYSNDRTWQKAAEHARQAKGIVRVPNG